MTSSLQLELSNTYKIILLVYVGECNFTYL